MRSFSFVHILLLLVFLLAYQCTQAQNYAVTIRGDTLRGDVRLFNYGQDKKVQVQADGKQKENVPLIQTRMVFLDEETYKPQKGPDGYAYMKLVKEGYLSVYAFQLNNQVTYDGLLLVKLDGSSIEVPNLTFKKVMKRFLEDCPAIANKIEAGEYGRRDLYEIVDAYNNCLNTPVAKTTTSPPAVVTTTSAPEAATTKLDTLEEKVRDQEELTGKQDILDMITEIRNKLQRGEKVPNFMVEGLKSMLRETPLNTALEEALAEIQ